MSIKHEITLPPFPLRFILPFFQPINYDFINCFRLPVSLWVSKVEYLFLIPSSPQYLLKALLSNWRPFSEIKVCGTSNLVTIFFQTRSHLQFPSAFGKGPTISKPHWVNCQGLESGFKAPPGWWIFGAYL